MSALKKISVIIPCYNHGKYLNDSLESLINQSYKNWEAIIVNDGSQDETELIAKSLTKRDARIKYVYKKNGGLSSARNEGLKNISGDYVQFLDADDALHPQKFEMQIRNLLKEESISLSYCDYFSSIESDLQIAHTNRYRSPELKTNNYFKEIILDWEYRISIPCHCFLFDTRIFLDRNIRFNENLANHEDWACWVDIFALKPSVFYVNEKLATYRIRDNAMCANVEKMIKGHNDAIDDKIEKYKNNEKIVKWLKRKKMEVNQKGVFRLIIPLREIKSKFVSLVTK